MDKEKEFLKDSLEKEYGKEMQEEILNGMMKPRKTTFRVNTNKITSEEIEQILNDNNTQYQKVDWYQDAYILEDKKEKDLEQLEVYKEGKIYLQSLSSMLPPFVLNPKENESILDMAASPGGKTTLLANLSNQKALITAVEKNKIRADRLKYNIERQGSRRIHVIVSDARALDDYLKFDKILLDAPCSGSGTLDLSDPKIEKYFSKKLVINSSKTQKELLKKAISLTKVGGEITYSTCSILKEENEQVIEEALKTKKVEIIPITLFQELPQLQTTIEGVICIRPTDLYEGFFVAKLKKIKE